MDKLNNLLSFNDFDKSFKPKVQTKTKRTEVGLDIINESHTDALWSVRNNFLKEINPDKIKHILQGNGSKYWIMGSVRNGDPSKRCQVYVKDGKTFFENYDGKVYSLDLSEFSRFLVDN